MRSWMQISHLHSHPLLLLPPTSYIHCKISYSAASLPPDWRRLYKECNEFLPWLRQRTGQEISSVLSIGFSSHGRSLFASEPIRAGDCILKLPYSAHLTADKFHSVLVDDVDDISRLAVVLLAEKKRGQDSAWAPYVQSLPHMKEMHSTMFWSNEELDMLRVSSIYQEILNQKAHLEKEFFALEPVMNHSRQMFGDFTLENFMHAYALIISRAWGTSRGMSLIPFADFFNHDGGSKAVLLNDDTEEASEVIADRDYAAGEQVLLSYGKFSNSTLMMDFGFTFPDNHHDEVQIQIDIPKLDPLHTLKLELLRRHHFPQNQAANSLKSLGSFFIMREVKCPKGTGKGIPLALRAYARVLSVTSHEGLKALQMEAADNDGRLARHPLRNSECEIHAHRILLSHFTRMIQDRDAAVRDLESLNSPCIHGPVATRKKMAVDLINGELRVLKSACAWITNYCAKVSASRLRMLQVPFREPSAERISWRCSG